MIPRRSPDRPPADGPRIARAICLVAPLLLAACASDQPAPVEDLSEESAPPSGPVQVPPQRTPDVGGVHHVVRGDTLYAIAFRNGLDYRDIATWNGIASPYRIYVGQDLRLTPPGSAAPASSAIAASAPSKPASASPPPTPAPVAAQPSKQAAAAAMFEDVPAEAAEKPGVAPTPPAPPAVAATPPAVVQPAPKPPEPPARSPPVEADSAAKAAPAQTGVAKIADDSVTTTNGLTWRWPGRGTLAATFVAGDQTRQGIDIAGKSGDPVLAAGDGEVVYSGNGLLGYGELIIVKHNASFLSAYGHNRKRLVQEGDRVKAGQQIAEMGSSAASRDQLHFEIRKNGKPVNPLDYLPAR